MTLFHAVLNCHHPLCGERGPEESHRARVMVIAARAADEAAFHAARAAFADVRDRRCRACHRPIALKHLTLLALDDDLCVVQRHTSPEERAA